MIQVIRGGVAAAAVALCLAGCGGQSKQPPQSVADAERQLRSLIVSYKGALESGDAATVCGSMSRSEQNSVVSVAKRSSPVTTCVEAMRLVFGVGAAHIRNIAHETTLRAIHVNGDSATIVSSRAGKAITSRATREGGTWKLSEFPG
jgi:hypothetical protein